MSTQPTEEPAPQQDERALPPTPQQRSSAGIALVICALVMGLLLYLNIDTFKRVHNLEQELVDARQQLLTYEMRVESGLAEQRNLKSSLELAQQEKKECKSDLASYRRQIDEILPSALDIGKKLDDCFTERDSERAAKETLTAENETLKETLKNCQGDNTDTPAAAPEDTKAPAVTPKDTDAPAAPPKDDNAPPSQPDKGAR